MDPLVIEKELLSPFAELFSNHESHSVLFPERQNPIKRGISTKTLLLLDF
jgi:hypothetical protein